MVFIKRIVLTKGWEHLQNGIPFDLHLPAAHSTAIGGMTQAEWDAEFAKGIESMKSGKTYSADEIDAELAEE